MALTNLTPKFYLNENIPIRLVNLLNAAGIQAVHTLLEGNNGKSDEFQLDFAASRQYILVTHNRRDFRLLHRKWMQEGRAHSGILVMQHNEPENLAKRIKLFVDYCYPTIAPPFCEVPPVI